MTERKSANVGDSLRAEFIIETVERMAAHLTTVSIFIQIGDIATARGFWDCARLCGKSISQTIDEWDGGAK